MTKPGPHRWATGDTYASGPDIGSNTKTVPLSAHIADGYYRGRRPAPDILNWQLNRNYLTHLSVARLQAMNYTLAHESLADYNTGLLKSSYHSYDSAGRDIYCALIYYDSTNTNLKEIVAKHGVDWNTPTSEVLISSVTSAPISVDADGDDAANRVAVAHWSGATDQVVYATDYTSNWGAITWSGGAPGHEWYGVACDRDTAGNGAAHWCICGFGSTDMQIWSSTDGVTFADETGFPSSGSALRGVYHSCHPAGALGPDDAGNPVWLTNNSVDQIYYSTNHTSWSTGALLSAYDLSSPRALAYSRPQRRWVAAHSGTSFGAISYSDDNGVTWTTNTSALPIHPDMAKATTQARIAGDGYGTFVVTRNVQPDETGSHMWASVDDGVTWSMFKPCDDIDGDTGRIVEGCFYESADLDEATKGGGFFIYAGYYDGGPETQIMKSLVV